MREATKVIGIIGGMGPAATVAFMDRIIKATPASDDADHFRMIVDNNPKVPSRIDAIIRKTGEDPLPELKRMAVGLERAGADFLVMPCNTAHYYHAGIAEAVGIPFPHIVDITAEHLRTEWPKAKRIGFLASPAVQQTQLYHDRFARQGLSVVYPDAEGSARLLGIIQDVKAGQTAGPQVSAFHEAAESLAKIVDLILVACTELSILPIPTVAGVPVLDTLDLLVNATVMTAYGTSKAGS